MPTFKLKDTDSLLQLTLLKMVVVGYFIFITWNVVKSEEFFGDDNAKFGLWTCLSFLFNSLIILSVDFAIIERVCSKYKHKRKRVYILVFESTLCLVVYLGFTLLFSLAKG